MTSVLSRHTITVSVSCADDVTARQHAKTNTNIASFCSKRRVHNTIQYNTIQYNTIPYHEHVFACSYADDMAILSPPASGFQKLLNVCANYATKHDIIHNIKKTQCMFIQSARFKLQNTPSDLKKKGVDSCTYIYVFFVNLEGYMTVLFRYVYSCTQ